MWAPIHQNLVHRGFELEIEVSVSNRSGVCFHGRNKFSTREKLTRMGRERAVGLGKEMRVRKRMGLD